MEKKVPKKVSIFQQERAKGQNTPFCGLGFVLNPRPAMVDSFVLRDVTENWFQQEVEGENEH